MKAYFLVFFLTLLIQWILPSKTDRQCRIRMFCTFVPLFLFGSLRVDFGNDYPAYEFIFNTFHMGYSDFIGDEEAHAEIGYQYLCYVMPSFRSILVLNSFLLCLSFGIFLYNNVPNHFLWFALILIFLNPEKNIYGNLVAIRNGLVISGLLLGSVLIQKRKLLYFGVLTALLFTIHTSALIFMPLAYFFGYDKPFTKKEFLIWLAFITIIIFASMTQIADVILFFMEGDYLERYQQTLEAIGDHRGILMMISSLIFIAIFLFYLNKQNYVLSSNQRSLLRLGILFSVLMLLGSLSTRTSYYYDMFFITSIILVYSDNRVSKNLRYLIVTLALLSSLYSLYAWISSPWWNHAVYHSLIGSW